MQTTNLTLKKFEENFNFLEQKMKNSQMYKDALNSFQENMQSFSFSDDQVALAYSDFMAKTFLGVFNTCVQSALTIDQNEVATREAQNIAALNILAKKKEALILSNQANESHVKVQATKMQSVQLQAQALQDKIKAEVLHKSANDNAQINKANCMVSYQNVLANANKPDLLSSYNMQETTAKALQAIGEAKISDYTAELKKVEIPELEIEDKNTIIEIYAIKNIVAINEIIAFNCLSPYADTKVTWDFGDDTSASGECVHKAYKTSGVYTIKATINTKDSLLQRNLEIIVKDPAKD